MSIRKMRRHSSLAMIFGVVLLSGLFASTSTMAQNFQLEDMAGMWAFKIGTCPGGSFSYGVYQVTTGPASLTLRYVRTDTSCGAFPISVLYKLTVTDRSLSGTVTEDLSEMARIMQCTASQRTFPVKGRISPDGNAITIIDDNNHELPDIKAYHCGWKQNDGSVASTLYQFERYH